MSLFQFELRKLLLNKKTFILLFVLFIFYAVSGYLLCSFSLGGKANYEAYSSLVDQQIKTNNPDQAAISTAAYADAKKKYGDSALDDVVKVMPDLMFNVNYAQYIEHLDEYYNGSTKDAYNNPYGINVLEANIVKLEANGDTTSFTHKKLENQLSVEKSLGPPVYTNTVLWEKLFATWGNVIAVILLFLPIAFIIAPVFSVEAATGMDNLILSSLYGRKKIVTAKLATVSITSIIAVLNYILATFLGNFISMGSFLGWDAALRSVGTYVRAPIGASVWQFALITVVWLLFGGGFLGILFTFVSSKVKNIIASFGVGLGIIFGSLLLGDYSENFPAVFRSICKFVPSDLIQLSKLFSTYTVFNIFGMVVPYYVIALVLIAVLTGIMILAIYHFQKKRTVA